ncbi:MAG: hypothetical protein BCS36_01315 [Desulfovibrio sp. MES5]|uniref:hypothetical protein n=1 Tax=Desulfovibrio sp. MES5 TaxID=1899016 RepID=UPI000B9CCD21|nr:hypothetical protein [Desulfovibrio sp. MES5]OXS29091.1 MAG: hypothetical protein BCS36_01315 [Desulfovibrio sp. MES5]
MFVTHYKNAVLARTLRPVALGVAILCFGVTSGMSGVSFAGVAESSLPQTLPDGGPNLTEAWMRTGGARLYWNTLTQPRQIRMVGAAFADPAAVPELMSSPQGQPDVSTGKGSRGGKTAPHSIVVDPKAPARPWPHATSRPAKQGGTTAVQAGKKSEAAQAARTPAEKPASVSPALTAPSSSRQGNGNGTAAVAPSPSVGIGNGVAAPSGAAKPSGVPPAAASTSASSSASSAAPSMSVTGSGAAVGAFGKAGVGSVRSSNGGAQADVPIPPPVPSLTADDLLPPSNGAGSASGGGGAPARAPLP